MKYCTVQNDVHLVDSKNTENKSNIVFDTAENGPFKVFWSIGRALEVSTEFVEAYLVGIEMIHYLYCDLGLCRSTRF